MEGGLLIPSAAMVNLVIDLEKVIRRKKPLVINTKGVGSALFASCMCVVQQHDSITCYQKRCDVFTRFVVKLYVRIRIHHFLKEESRRMSQPKQKRNRKFLKVAHL